MSLKRFVILSIFLSCFCMAFCVGDTLCGRFYFPTGSSLLDLAYRNNGARLDSLVTGIRSRMALSELRRLRVCSAASPEGISTSNKQLSDKRFFSLQRAIQDRLSITDSVFVSVSLGVDWERLASLVEASDMPCREEVLHIIRFTPVWVVRDGIVVDSRKKQLMDLRGGDVWHYMENYFFPELRHSSVVECEFDPISKAGDPKAVVRPQLTESTDTIIVHSLVQRILEIRDKLQIDIAAIKVDDVANGVIESECVDVISNSCDNGNKDEIEVYNDSEMTDIVNPLFINLKTNMLYDALLVPNIGAEFYLGKGWSVGGNSMYAWWNLDSKHYYWRIYGGDLSVRKYFGSRAAHKPLSGHHLGVYAQAFIYDFELGNKGYMGGRPGSSLWKNCNYVAGVEYGYSLPIARRLNLEFSIGVGYWGGEYQLYIPDLDQYTWQETRRRRWFGPTKAEISLVWLLGRGNSNHKKGGRR